MANQRFLNAAKEAPIPDPGRVQEASPLAKPRGSRGNGGGDEDPNAQPAPGTDRVWGIAGRARWGADSSDVTEMHRESRVIEGSLPADQLEQEEELEEEEELDEAEPVDPATLSVAELKQALTGAGVDVPSGAKKAELVQLYKDNGVGEEQEEQE